MLVAVIRDFEDDAVPPYRNRVDPRADLAELWDEFLFADFDTVSTRVERLEKALAKPTKSHEQEKRELALLTRCGKGLENNQPLSSIITGNAGVTSTSVVSSLGGLPDSSSMITGGVLVNVLRMSSPPGGVSLCPSLFFRVLSGTAGCEEYVPGPGSIVGLFFSSALPLPFPKVIKKKDVAKSFY